MMTDENRFLPEELVMDLLICSDPQGLQNLQLCLGEPCEAELSANNHNSILLSLCPYKAENL